VRGPFGTTWPLTEARGKDVLVVVGGIGLAPLRPAIYHILRHRGDYRRLVVLYGARSPRDLLYKKQLTAWGYVPDTQILTTVDYGGLSWRGYVSVWSPPCSAMGACSRSVPWRWSAVPRS
jgi:NAD(P)H-flavin reductase